MRDGLRALAAVAVVGLAGDSLPISAIGQRA